MAPNLFRSTRGARSQPWTEESPFELPDVVVNLTLENDTRFLDTKDKIHEFFAIKFCPYQPLDQSPIFAAISKKHVVVCRLSQDPDTSDVVEDIKIIRDDNAGVSNCSCAWVQDPVSGVPYLCVAGADAHIKMYDVIADEVVESFIGHGGGINDLATSPVDPTVIASASDDSTVRIWSIAPAHREQPCLCILAGEGHIAEVLTIAFHNTGRYVLSGGHDHRIILWTLPDLPTKTIETPKQIHYPHFVTSAIHGGIVDCVAFYGDKVLSRANHDDVIVLWEILGFSSKNSPPSQDVAPLPQIPQPNDHGPGQFTRSAFLPSTSQEYQLQYERLLQLHTPSCEDLFFMRFQLHHQPDQNPVLCFSNKLGEVFFWDFERVKAYGDLLRTLKDPKRNKTTPVRLPRWLGRLGAPPSAKSRSRAGSSRMGSTESSLTPEVDSARNVTSLDEINPRVLSDWNAMYSVRDSSLSLEPHLRIDQLKEPSKKPGRKAVRQESVGRQVAWSPGGEWCVVAGSSNLVQVLRRWNRADIDDRLGRADPFYS